MDLAENPAVAYKCFEKKIAIGEKILVSDAGIDISDITGPPEKVSIDLGIADKKV